MDKRKIGTSDIEVVPLALGGNVFGWTIDDKMSFSILDAFVDQGGTMIDTADAYSRWVPGHQGGESEAVIGRWLKRDPSKRDRIVIATKVGMISGLAPAEIVFACDQSLSRLGIEAIDLYYQHRDDPKVPLEESLGAFDQLRKQGKIREVGLSNFTAERIDQAFAAVSKCGLAPPVALQPKYNLLERGFEQELQPAAERHGLGILPYYGLASGFLTGKYRRREDFAKGARGSAAKAYFNDQGFRVLSALDQLAAETGAALATIALAWLMAQPRVVSSLASATSVDQLNELTAAMNLDLTRDQLGILDSASSERLIAPA